MPSQNFVTDEPWGRWIFFDASEAVQELIFYAHRATVLMVTHDVEEAVYMSISGSMSALLQDQS